MNLCVNTSGEDHLDVADIYCNLGSIYILQQHYSLALERYQRALRIYSKIHSEAHPDVAYSYREISNVYAEQGNYEEALKH
ncbi:MAG: tetratricopeptide repeat protein [Bacteroidota bacterium]